MTRFKGNNIKLQTDASKIYLRVIQNFDHLICHDDMASEYTLNGLPIFHEFLNWIVVHILLEMFNFNQIFSSSCVYLFLVITANKKKIVSIPR